MHYCFKFLEKKKYTIYTLCWNINFQSNFHQIIFFEMELKADKCLAREILTSNNKIQQRPESLSSVWCNCHTGLNSGTSTGRDTAKFQYSTIEQLAEFNKQLTEFKQLTELIEQLTAVDGILRGNDGIKRAVHGNYRAIEGIFEHFDFAYLRGSILYRWGGGGVGVASSTPYGSS